MSLLTEWLHDHLPYATPPPPMMMTIEKLASVGRAVSNQTSTATKKTAAEPECHEAVFLCGMVPKRRRRQTPHDEMANAVKNNVVMVDHDGDGSVRRGKHRITVVTSNNKSNNKSNNNHHPRQRSPSPVDMLTEDQRHELATIDLEYKERSYYKNNRYEPSIERVLTPSPTEDLNYSYEDDSEEDEDEDVQTEYAMAKLLSTIVEESLEEDNEEDLEDVINDDDSFRYKESILSVGSTGSSYSSSSSPAPISPPQPIRRPYIIDSSSPRIVEPDNKGHGLFTLSLQQKLLQRTTATTLQFKTKSTTPRRGGRDTPDTASLSPASMLDMDFEDDDEDDDDENLNNDRSTIRLGLQWDRMASSSSSKRPMRMTMGPRTTYSHPDVM